MQASTATQGSKRPAKVLKAQDLLRVITDTLDDKKAEDIVSIDLNGKSSIADFMVIATGRSQRQVSALADYVVDAMKKAGHKDFRTQGQEQADWILIDAGDVVIHLFRPEVRDFYGLDKMWGTRLDETEVIN